MLEKSFKNICLIDFGASSYFLNHHGKHVEQKFSDKAFTANPIFASQHVMGGSSHSRRDDILQLVYCMSFMINPYQHWIENRLNNVLSYTDILTKK